MDNTGRYGEETMFDIICSMGPPDENEEDDGSQYLNNIGDGMIDEDEQIYEDNDDEGNVDLQITKTGEVYIYIRDLVIITFLN
jgi:hypothetical protein